MAPDERKKTKEQSSYHHGDLRNALIRAGVEILRTGGAQALSLREAARTAGVSQAAPYRHFKNKDALIAAIVQEGFTRLGEQIRDTTHAFHADPAELFHQSALSYLKLASEHTDHFRLMFAGMPKFGAKNYPELERVAHGLFKQFVSVVVRCQRERIVRAGNSEQLALVAWCSFHGFTSLLVNNNLRFLALSAPQRDLAMRALSRNLLEGLKPA